MNRLPSLTESSSSSSTAIEPSILSTRASTSRKCKECDYFGPEESFPLPLKSAGYGYVKRLMNCQVCTERMRQREENKRAKAIRKKMGIPEPETIPTTHLNDLLGFLKERRGQTLTLDVYALIPDGMDMPDLENSRMKKAGTEDVFRLTNAVRNQIHIATGFGWSQKKRALTNGERATVVTYYCSQLEEERPKHKERLSISGRKPQRHSKERYHCNGWLNIYVTHSDKSRIRIRMTHDLVHPYPTPNATHSTASKERTPEDLCPVDCLQDGALSIDAHSPDANEFEATSSKVPRIDDIQSTQWLPPIVASSRLPQSLNEVRVSSMRDALPTITASFQRIISAAYNGVDSHTAARIDVLFMEITRLGESLGSINPS